MGLPPRTHNHNTLRTLFPPLHLPNLPQYNSIFVRGVDGVYIPLLFLPHQPYHQFQANTLPIPLKSYLVAVTLDCGDEFVGESVWVCEFEAY